MLGEKESERYLNYSYTPTGQKENWRAKIKIELDNRKYLVSTVDNNHELREALSLRNRVFHESFPSLARSLSGLDHLDYNSDFLYVKDKKTDSIIATYRLIHSKLSPEFYSSSEFDISEFLSQEGTKLELSRACVDEAHRNGIVIHLLWRGVAAYMAATQSRFLFGLTSVKSYDLRLILDIYKYLRTKGHVGESFEVHPIQSHSLISWYGLSKYKSGDDSVKLPKETPPLLRSYLKAGAEVYGPPAIDHEFGCFDFFTVLNFDKISKTHSDKYLDT